MIVLKHFKPPCSPPPTRGSGKVRMQGKWTSLERVFGATPVCVVWKSIVQFTGLQAAVAPSTLKHLMDTPAVQLGRIGLATAVTWPSKDSQASASTQISRRDLEGHQENFSAVPLSGKERHKTHTHCTASGTSRPSSVLLLHGVLFIPSEHHMSSKCKKLQHWTRNFLLQFFSMESRQMQINYEI